MGQSTSTGVLCPPDTTTTYSCENPYPNCTNTTGLDFEGLWIVSQLIYDACPTDWRIFDRLPGEATLTCAGCEQLTGTTGARLYDPGYVWNRIALWKIPLINLVLLLPQSPLGLLVQVFVTMRLIGNPIGTVQGYFFKMASCQQRATDWKHSLQNESEWGLKEQSDCCIKYNRWERKWRALAMVTNAYDEWGLEAGTQARNSIQRQLNVMNQTERDFLIAICQRTSNELARARITQLLPIVSGEVIFIVAIGLAFIKSDVLPTHAIALSTLHFWIIPAIFLAAVVGVSQTESAVPEILRRFENDFRLHSTFQPWQLQLPDIHIKLQENRRTLGGIYSWQTQAIYKEVAEGTLRKIQDNNGQGVIAQDRKDPGSETQSIEPQNLKTEGITHSTGSERLRFAFYMIIPSLPVATAAATSFIISWLVPPVGFNCRSISELVLLVWWVFIFCLDFHPYFRTKLRRTMIKDTVSSIGTIVVILVTLAGVMNSCSCDTLWGTAGMVLPKSPMMNDTSSARIVLTFICILLQLLFVPLVIGWIYPDATLVFIQRDDEKSDFHMLHRVCKFFSGICNLISRKALRVQMSPSIEMGSRSRRPGFDG